MGHSIHALYGGRTIVAYRWSGGKVQITQHNEESETGMPRKPRTPKTTTKQTEDYQHEDATRLNNPPAGLADVNPIPSRDTTPQWNPRITWPRNTFIALTQGELREALKNQFSQPDETISIDNRLLNEAGARKWVEAVNYAGSHGRWDYDVCKDAIRSKIAEVVAVRM